MTERTGRILTSTVGRELKVGDDGQILEVRSDFEAPWENAPQGWRIIRYCDVLRDRAGTPLPQRGNPIGIVGTHRSEPTVGLCPVTVVLNGHRQVTSFTIAEIDEIE